MKLFLLFGVLVWCLFRVYLYSASWGLFRLKQKTAEKQRSRKAKKQRSRERKNRKAKSREAEQWRSREAKKHKSRSRETEIQKNSPKREKQIPPKK